MKEGLSDKQRKFISYLRVSTDRQGQSGLGLDAQRQAVTDFLLREQGELLIEYVEIESGAEKNRPELLKALTECRRTKSILVIAKLDRLARNVHVISGLLESGVEFVAVDNPHATKLMLHLLAAFAEHEREMIASRTKAALAAAKKRGVKLGTSGLQRAKENKDAADKFAWEMAPLFSSLHERGITTALGLAHELNRSAVRTSKDGRWHAATVIRIVSRLRNLQIG